MEGVGLLYPETLNRTGVARAVFTTRLGGYSQPPWKGLNLGLHVGDRSEDVLANRENVSSWIGVSLDDWVCGEQVHGKHVYLVSLEDKGRGARSYTESIPGTDGLITNQRGIVLSTFAADCVPILLCDPVTKSIAAVHAGWKGTRSRIAGEAVKLMQRQFGSRPVDLVAAIGPAIGKCCYEVDEHVYLPFMEEFQDGNNFFEAKQAGKWQLSLVDANREILKEAGLHEGNIERCGGCTACDTATYFSHRAEQGRTGRLAGLIYLV